MENTNTVPSVRRRGRPSGQFEQKVAKLYELIKAEPNMKISQAALVMGVTTRQVCRYFAELRKRKAIPEAKRFRAEGEWVSFRQPQEGVTE